MNASSNTTKEKESQADESKFNKPALLAPRYLLPALANEETGEWSRERLFAMAGIGLFVLIILALYIYGSTVVGV